MKVANKLAVLLSLGALLPLAASAKTLEQTYLESCRKDPGIPIPIAVVSPPAGSGFVGEMVEVEFTVDAMGKTSGFTVMSKTDATVADAIVEAVKQWQFAPAERNGEPVATKVLLPVRFIDDSLAGTR